MRSLINIKFGIIVVLFIITSVYILSYIQMDKTTSEDMYYQSDTTPPSINMISGDIKDIAGETATISVIFSDNVEVTTAKIFYKPESAIHWSSKSILKGNVDISLPAFSNESWYYYVIVDDAEGNGPIGDPSIDGSTYYTIAVLPQTINESDANNSRSVFVEIGTKIVCSECPKISYLMYDLYKSGELPFYYVSLPIDNPKSAEYLTRYNLWGYPTVFIDGGYEITVGSSVDKAMLQEKITLAANRIKPKLQIHSQVEYINKSQLIRVDINIKNDEATSYTGELRVYLTEIISKKWQAGTPEHFSFLSFLIIEPVELIGYGYQTFTTTAELSDLDPENLMIFSVVSNTEEHIEYSRPPDKNEFKAHYIDAITATTVIKNGNLPPELGIENPSVKYFHLLGKPIRKTILGKTILLGRTLVVVNARDDSTITKVEFYINDKLMKTATQEPYKWMWYSFSIGKKTITVKAYDDSGKSSTASIDVIVFIKWPGLFYRVFAK